MTITTFDKLAYSEALKAGGFTHEQATVQANALDTALRESVATKHDIELLRSELRKMEQRIEHKLTLRLGTMMVVSVGAVAALVKLL